MLAGQKIKVLKASPVNPAIALSILIFNAQNEIWKSIWIFLSMSCVGSLLALFFFRGVYEKTKESIDQMEDAE